MKNSTNPATCPASTSYIMLNLFGGIAHCDDSERIQWFDEHCDGPAQKKQADQPPHASGENGNTTQ